MRLALGAATSRRSSFRRRRSRPSDDYGAGTRRSAARSGRRPTRRGRRCRRHLHAADDGEDDGEHHPHPRRTRRTRHLRPRRLKRRSAHSGSSINATAVGRDAAVPGSQQQPTPDRVRLAMRAALDERCGADAAAEGRGSPISLGRCVTAALTSQLNPGFLGTLLVADDPDHLRAVGWGTG
jgi:hypothetical protein